MPQGTMYQNSTIICVDDDHAVLESFRQVLTPEKDALDSILETKELSDNDHLLDKPTYNLLLASSGEEALNILQEELEAGNRVAAGFFDIRMPGGMDGYETIKRVRQLDPEIYCAVITAYTDRDIGQISQLFQNKHQDHFLYFKKPFSTIELEQTALNLVASWNRKINEQTALKLLDEVKNDWQDVFHTIKDAIIILDRDNNIVRANNAVESLFGTSPISQIGNNYCQLLYQTDIPPSHCPYPKTLKTKAPATNQFHNLLIGKYLEIKTLPRFDNKNRVYGVILIARDITKAITAQKALKKSEERFRNLTEMLPVAVYEMDLNGKITFANKYAFDCFGYNKEDFYKGISGLDLICENDRAMALVNIEKLKNNTYCDSNEYYGQKKNGTTFPTIFNSAMVIHDNKPLGIRGVIIDISEKKNLEQKLLQSQKMEAIGTLAGGIAHDFNNILSAIMGYSELAELKLSENPTVARHLAEILSASERAKELVQQILTFSRKTEQQKQPLQISQIVTEALKLLRSSIPSTINIEQNISSNSFTLADPTQIQQIVMNLCTNAYHAMRETGGTLTVSLTETELISEKTCLAKQMLPGSYSNLVISDTGIGMSNEIKAKIFDPYFTTKGVGEGTGLGLAVVHGVVESHAGRIEVESKPGKGTTFHIFLPVYKGKADISHPQKLDIPLQGNGETIMLVDDEYAILDITREFLETHNYKVECFTDGVQALKSFNLDQTHFDLILTDMTMPLMTGIQLAQKVLDVKPELPIILNTGHNELINREKSLSIGIKEHLEKPIHTDSLLRTVRKVLDNAKLLGLRIMIIDDDHFNIDLATGILRHLGCEVTGLTNSQDALKLFMTDPYKYDIILTDNYMPHMSGIDLVKHILKKRADMPIVLISGDKNTLDTTREQVTRSLEFLSKPYEMDELVYTIVRAISVPN